MQPHEGLVRGAHRGRICHIGHSIKGPKPRWGSQARGGRRPPCGLVTGGADGSAWRLFLTGGARSLASGAPLRGLGRPRSPCKDATCLRAVPRHPSSPRDAPRLRAGPGGLLHVGPGSGGGVPARPRRLPRSGRQFRARGVGSVPSEWNPPVRARRLHPLDPLVRDRSGAQQATVGHESAPVVHDLGDRMPAVVHLVVPRGFRKKRPAECELHQDDLEPDDIEEREGFFVTTPLRTLLDLAERPGFSTAVLREAAARHCGGDSSPARRCRPVSRRTEPARSASPREPSPGRGPCKVQARHTQLDIYEIWYRLLRVDKPLR